MDILITVCGAVTKRINDLLAKNDWTLYRLSAESGVIYNTLKKVVNNANKGINLSLVIQIANGFGMTLEQFVSDPVFKYDGLQFD